jgi:protein ImuB
VLVVRRNRKRVLLATDRVARSLGLHPGMDATKAQILIPGLTLHEAEPAEDQAALDRLAAWALQRYAPIVAPDPPDGLVIDATGCAHLHGSEQAMLADLRARLAGFGCESRATMADHWGAAHGLARYGGAPLLVIQPGGAEAILRPLPLAALRLPAPMVDALNRLGFERISDLLDQPRAPLTLRFGPELWRRIDQALGHLSEPIEAHRPPDTPQAHQAFAEPIGTAEAIAQTIAALTTHLCEQLTAQGIGVRQLDLLLHRIDHRLETIRAGTAAPVRDPVRLTRLLTDKIETIDPGLGIELMQLVAVRTEPLAARQTISSLAAPPEPDITGLIDILANRLGPDRIYRVAPVASDVPERAITRIAPTAPATKADWPGRWPRPPRLLSPPERIETIAPLPDHPPVHFRWRGVRHRVRCADGPERIFGEWWKRDAELAAVRDYFRVENEQGQRFWIYRAGDGEDAATGSHEWFLHGLFG